MKKQKIALNKKLALGKSHIIQLNVVSPKQVLGGDATSINPPCRISVNGGCHSLLCRSLVLTQCINDTVQSGCITRVEQLCPIATG